MCLYVCEFLERGFIFNLVADTGLLEVGGSFRCVSTINFHRCSYLVLSSLHVTFDRDTLHVFAGMVLWLWWWLEIPRAGTKNVSLQMAHPNSETTRCPVAKSPARISDV